MQSKFILTAQSIGVFEFTEQDAPVYTSALREAPVKILEVRVAVGVTANDPDTVTTVDWWGKMLKKDGTLGKSNRRGRFYLGYIKEWPEIFAWLTALIEQVPVPEVTTRG